MKDLYSHLLIAQQLNPEGMRSLQDFLERCYLINYLLCCLTHLPREKNGRHFADDIFRCIFVNEYFRILIRISLKLVSNDPIDNNPALVKIMAWRRKGDKSLSQPMLTRFTNAYMWH